MSLNAQDDVFKYSQKFTISGGLAHNGVTSMIEDSRGFLWFGTYDGINKYDGYNFTTYKNTIDRDILTSNRIRTLAEDYQSNLWIGTDEGVTVYNFTSERFTKIRTNISEGRGLNGPTVRKIIINKKSGLTICATEGEGLLVYGTDLKLKGKYIPSNEVFGNDVMFFDGIQFKENYYLFATSSGLVLFNTDSNEFEPVLNQKIKYVNSIKKYNSNTLVITERRGVAFVHFKQGNATHNTFRLKERKLQSYRFNNVMIDASNKLWLGELNKGIVRVDGFGVNNSNNTLDIKTFDDELTILRSSAFLTTSNGNYWYATFNEGVYKFNAEVSPFKSYNINMNYNYGIQTNSVTHLEPFDAHRAFILANRGGLALFNFNKRRFEPLPFSFGLSKKENFNIGAFYRDSKKNIWLFSVRDSKLFRVKHGQSNFEEVTLKGFAEASNLNIRSFTEDRFGNLWIGAINGVYKINITSSNKIGKVEQLNENPYFKSKKITLARRVYADPKYDFIWIGADSDGLFRVKNEAGKSIKDLSINQFIHDKSDATSLSSNFVSSIVRLPNNGFWVGTEGGGVCEVIDSDTSPQFIAYTEKDGLSNNVVKSILYDDDNNLWIPTNIGLNKLNVQNKEIRKFNESDGLPFEDFWFASKRLDNGMMVLSGLDGFCYFNPSSVNKTESLPKLQFENFKIFDNTIKPIDTINGRVLLPKSLNELTGIELKHNENVFSLDLTSLHFSNTKNHFIKYKLTPINQDYIKVPSSQKTIYYNGLQPGDYELSVLASNSLNEWTTPKTLAIVITPSIWKTKLAYMLYAILSFLLIYIIIKVILKIQSLNHKVEIEQIEINNVKELNEAKLRFFSNISHEIKTPLTLISGPVNILLERFKSNPEIGDKLSLVQRQSKKIKQLLEQVHDFRRADANALKMNYERFTFNTFMNELTEDFNFFAKNDNKEFEVEGEKAIITVSADRDKLEKIFNNLINNAFKYTRTNDAIKIVYSVEGKDIIVSVIDTGRGIDSEDLEHIFERFYQANRQDNSHVSGSGIGLAFSKRLVEMHYGFIKAESELGKGTKIEVRLPIVKEVSEKEVIERVVLPEEKEVLVDNHFFKKSSTSNVEVTGEFSEAQIFYAEDNPEMRNFVSGILSKFFKVTSFRNGKECYDALENEWPDIIISDVQMPEMNGLDLCVKVKADLKTSHIPVVLLTALGNIEDHLKGIRDGADAYIKKPFNIQHLITNIEALLTNRKQLRERYQVGIPLTKENNKNNKNDNAFLDKLYSLIEENIDNQNFDLNSLAKELYLNRTHFYQKVKVLTNHTPFELLKVYRLKKAADLLIQEKLSVNEVYILTGFKSRTHFAKIFKEKYNVSPGKYAKEINKKYDLDNKEQ